MNETSLSPFSSAAPAAPLPLPGGAVRLRDWGLIRAAGEDAAKFLHGQLTQDIEHLAQGDSVLAGYCSAKGRLLASFVVWRPAPDEILLACSADLLAPVLKRLQMFVLRARCKLSDASADMPLWGLAGAAAGAALDSAGRSDPEVARHTVRLTDAYIDGQPLPRWLHAGPAATETTPAPHMQALLALPALNLDNWHALEVLSGVPRIVAATSEQFVPQMVNLELVGGVNFKKGCYPGQEVVARSQYRGTIKRRAQVLHGAEPMWPGQEVFHSADPEQPAGRVVLGGSLAPGRHVALVELKLAALEGGSLHAGSASGAPLQVASLPYAIPLEAD